MGGPASKKKLEAKLKAIQRDAGKPVIGFAAFNLPKKK